MAGPAHAGRWMADPAHAGRGWLTPRTPAVDG